MRLKSVLREPLLHFLAIGAALFLFFQWRGPGSGPGSNRIVLTAGQIEHLAAGYAKVWQHPPTEANLKGLIDDWVREEIAVREAMAAGLDRDDTIIRRRLRQKLEFVVEDLTAEAAPTDQELRAWFTAHAGAFRIEPEGSVPDFAAVRPDVEREFLADRRKRQLAAMYERFLEKYNVVIERPEGLKTAATGKGGS